MAVNLDSKTLQSQLELICSRLSGIACDNNAAHVKTFFTVYLDQTKHVKIIGDAKVVADFVFFDIRCVDRDDDLGLICELKKHLKLTVWRKSR